MNDEKMEQAKKYFDKYDSLEEFKTKFLDIQKPANEQAIIQFFEAAKSNLDAWEMYKFQGSSDSLRLDKILKDNDIKQIVSKISEYDLTKYKRVMISLDNKSYEDLDQLKKFDIDIIIKVKGDKGLCTLDEFINMRNFFDYFKHQYSSFNLSELEKITIAYDYVKFFAYNEELNDRLADSRSIARVIKDGYIVCEGYCRIFSQLLKEFDINSYLMFIGSKTKGHVRSLININDPKYNVKGPFIFDPTWDSSMNMALLRHSDGTQSYEIESKQNKSDKILQKFNSDIRYLFYLIPFHENIKYFKKANVEKIQEYESGRKIEINDSLKNTLYFDDKYPKDTQVLDVLPDVLRKTKKIEGYSDEVIEFFIENVIELIKEKRYIIDDNKIK